MYSKWNVLIAGMVLVTVPKFLLADDCDVALSEKLMTVVESRSSDASASAARAWFCSMNYSEYKENSSTDAGGSYGAFSADYGSSEGKYNQWKSENCGDSSSSESLDTFRYQAQRSVDPKLVDAWRDCKLARSGLTCIATPTSNGRSFKLMYSWRPTGSSSAHYVETFIDNGVKVSTGNNYLREPGDKLLMGQHEALIRISDTEETASVSIEAEYDGSSQSCVVTVSPPPPPQVEKKGLAGVWCYPAGTYGAVNGQNVSLYARKFVKTSDGWRLTRVDSDRREYPYATLQSVSVQQNGEIFKTVEKLRPGMQGYVPYHPLVMPLPAPPQGQAGISPNDLNFSVKINYRLDGEDTLITERIVLRVDPWGERDYSTILPLHTFRRCD
ncbi:hypothetical protein [Pseudomonas sp. ML96]|uniref:hypothetical protein n=1 Tax=Pseudomonas sp. ML96 TaxID=1523503 RepID=UPI0012E03179|nr:hypothetical protein [Pseudomonas sp. ML96]